MALALAFGVALTRWPYARECGGFLAAYGFAVAVAVLAAVWVAVASWKLRDGVAHVLAVLLLLWGLALAAERVLPRIGYAAQQARWRCDGSTGILGPLTSAAKGSSGRRPSSGTPTHPV